MRKDPHDVVHLATAQNSFEAQIWQQALEADGIDSKVVGDFLEIGVGDIPGLQVEVWVHRNDLERAQAVLQEGLKNADVDPDESP